MKQNGGWGGGGVCAVQIMSSRAQLCMYLQNKKGDLIRPLLFFFLSFFYCTLFTKVSFYYTTQL